MLGQTHHGSWGRRGLPAAWPAMAELLEPFQGKLFEETYNSDHFTLWK